MTRKDRLILLNPLCCFCGGMSSSENIDHYPPRVLFDKKDRPKGFEFASCKACNDSSRNTDSVVSLFALMSHSEYVRKPSKLTKLAKGVKRSCRRSWNELVGSMSESFALSRELNGIRLGKNVLGHIHYFTRKMICAAHYHDTNTILSLTTPTDIIIQTEFDRLSGSFPFSNVDLGEYRTLIQGRKNKGDEFRLRHVFNDELGFGILEIHLHNQFYIHGCYYTHPYLIEEHALLSERKLRCLSEIQPPSEKSGLQYLVPERKTLPLFHLVP